MMKSVVSWSPAVPPPPVAGAMLVCVVGATTVGEGLAVGDASAVLAGVVPALAEKLIVESGAGELPAASEDAGDDVDDAVGVDPVQAEIAAEANMVMAPQPMTLNSAPRPVPAMVVRSFMEPPHAPRRCGGIAHGRHRHAMI
jgi:hypothetical protein